MSERIIIKCIISGSISINDLGVRLDGRGSTAVVLLSSASFSNDLKIAKEKKWVTTQLFVEDVMKIWPLSGFKKSLETPSPIIDNNVSCLLNEINNKLGELLERSISPTSEIVAAHVRNLASMPVVPTCLPGASPLPGIGTNSSYPQFFPSKLVPDVNMDEIHVKEDTSDREIDSNVNALKNLRRK